MTNKENIVVSGMRPTGPLHIGHYFGVLKNWLALQQQETCFFFAADWHCLTTDYAEVAKIRDYRIDMVINWLAAGVDPAKATLFMQSQVPQHAELHLLFSMITPISWLERVPSYKELRAELTHKDLSTYGFLGYPLLQTADVSIYKATHVPVGLDQAPHIELAREVVRRFNFLYKKEVFPEPKTLLTETPKLLGTDGRKMSKSYDNCIYLSDSAEETSKKLMKCITDPARKLRADPGNPDVCTIFSYHKLATPKEEIEQINADCRKAGIGCVDCKKILIKNLEKDLVPFRERRQKISVDQVKDILQTGAKTARRVAQKTLDEVNEAMGI